MRRAHWLEAFVGGALVVAACSSDGSGDAGETNGGSGADAGAPGDGRPRTVPPTSNPDGGPGDGVIAKDGGTGATSDAGVHPITYKHYDINHVLSTGASDSVANGGVPVLSTSQPFGNVSFDTGVITASNCDGSGCTVYQTPSSFVGLKEGDSFFDNSHVETMSSGLGNQATVFATQYFANLGVSMPRHDVLVSVHGRSGNPYWCLRLQTANVEPGYGPCYFPKSAGYVAPFDEALEQVRSAKTIAEAMGKTYVVRAVTLIGGQGESDSNEQNFQFLVSTDGQNRKLLDYTDALFDLQWDYETKVREITGQSEPIPMFISQFGSMATSESVIPKRQLDAHLTSKGKIVLVTPNYPFTHYTDCLHYNAYSQRRLGAYFAKAYQRVVVEGGVWEPTRPRSIERNGAILTVKYVVPVPPLVIDTTRVSADNTKFPVKPYDGFIFRDSTMSASITNVQVTAPDTVTITLSKVPTGASKVIRYAYEAQSTDRCPGPTNGARGNIRDSDTSAGYHVDENGKPYELFNWSVAFEMSVP